MTYVDEIKVGSTVWVGEAGDPLYKTTWTVVAIRQADLEHTYATVRSGQYGITRTFPLERLSLFRLKEGTP